jgi:hypothetical protein
LEAELEKEGATHKKAQDKIIKLLHSYGVDYKQAGKDLGHAFAVGLAESEGEVEKSAAGLAAVVARYLKTHSPSELGPMSDLDKWWTGMTPALVGGLDIRGLNSAVSTAATPGAVAPAAVGGFSGGAATYVINFNGHVWNERDAEDMIRSALYKAQNRFGPQGVS